MQLCTRFPIHCNTVERVVLEGAVDYGKQLHHDLT